MIVFSFARYCISEICAQPFHQLRRLDAQKTVVERVAQIGLREAAGNDERNSLGLQRRHRLLAAGAGAEVEAADQNIPAAVRAANCGS